MSETDRLAAEIYEDWREARQHLTQASPMSPETAMLLAEMKQLRLEYVALANEDRLIARRPREP